jgi:hypothetical protein
MKTKKVVVNTPSASAPSRVPEISGLLASLREVIQAARQQAFDASNPRYMWLYYQMYPNCDALRHELLALPSEEELRAELIREQRVLAEQTIELSGEAEGGGA